MLHFTCDLCGTPMNDERFVVKVAVYPAFDPEEISAGDLEDDHLQDVSEMLDQMEASGNMELEDVSAKTLRFDLCAACRKKYLKDPLARDTGRRLKFSQN